MGYYIISSDNNSQENDPVRGKSTIGKLSDNSTITTRDGIGLNFKVLYDAITEKHLLIIIIIILLVKK